MKANSGFSLRLLPVTALALLLAACGGGGGGGSDSADVTPDALRFTPNAIIDAEPGKTYEATATVTGFDGKLPARILGINGRIEYALIHNDSEVPEHDVSAGDTIRLRVAVLADARPGEQTQVTVAVGKGDTAQSTSLPIYLADPQIAIDFPPPLSTTHAETITLTGRWSGGDAPELTLVHNGTQTEPLSQQVFEEDGTWQMTVALIPERNEIGVENGSMDANVIVMRETPAPETSFKATQETDEGLAFDNPQTLTLDVENDRLLALSPNGIQRVRLSDGHRGVNDLFTMGASGSTLGGIAISGDKLWVTLNDGVAGLGTIDKDALGDGNSDPGDVFTPLPSESIQLGTRSSMIIEDDKAFVTIRGLTDRVQEIDLLATPTKITTVFDSANSGSARKHLFRFDETRLIGADDIDIYLVGPADGADTLGRIQLVFPADSAVLQDVSGYAYDSDRKRLYMAGRIENGAATAPLQFGWVDLSPLTNQHEGHLDSDDRVFTTIVQTDGENLAMPGYPARMDQLTGFAMEGQRQRLFALSGTGGNRNEVVAINLMAVAYDGGDEDDQFDKDEGGNLLRMQTGETVLISRSDQPRDE